VALLNSASKVYAGGQLASKVYLGATQVWPAGGPPVDPQIVWTEDWEGWPLGIPTATPPVSQVDGSPQIVAGKVLQSGPSGNGVRFSTAGMPHWSLEFTVVTTGTQTANHYVATLRNMAGAYVGELSLRNTEKQIWNRINYGADTLGKSVWTYAQPGPSTLRIIYEWMDDEFVKCHMFYGANLNGTMPDETTIYDKTMAAGILIGKRIGAVRLGNDSSDGLTQQFDNITLRDLTQ
jgi:hypothetical protein